MAMKVKAAILSAKSSASVTRNSTAFPPPASPAKRMTTRTILASRSSSPTPATTPPTALTLPTPPKPWAPAARATISSANYKAHGASFVKRRAR